MEGTTFCISEAAGDIRPGGAQGLFFRDTRVLSRWELLLDDAPPELLATQPGDPYAATFLARRPPQPGRADSTLLVVRSRYVGNGLREDLTVRNTGREASVVVVVVRVDVDFADLFAVKESRAGRREDIRVEVDPAGELRWRAGEEEHGRGVVVRATGPVLAVAGRLAWQAVVPAGGEWSTCLQVLPSVDGEQVPPRYRCGEAISRTEPARRLASWRRRAPSVTTGEEGFAALLAQGAEDLGALRVFDPEQPDRAVVAAGAPWFMTLFGRDSLLTSWMALPLDPGLALGTAETLARLQGRRVDPVTEEEPGRILHEVRSGLDSTAALGGGGVYYGSVDATPLFVMLLGELRRWGTPRETLAGLLPHADLALEWVQRYGDRDGDGFVEYQRATDHGLLNQGWKDSFDGVTTASGTPAEPPIALAEVQGYVYAAYRARAHLAREDGDTEAERSWLGRAEELKRAFTEKFWLPDRGWYALALDGQKRPVDALASNMGHCLWTGIVDRDKAAAVAAHLTGPELFSGFGIRTLATSMGAYNPMSYHNGSVWPHDTAIAVAGLMRYGFVREAQQVALALLDAAGSFGGRLPELFCGFDRAEFAAPVPYPTSCSPQAWAAAAPLLLLRTLLRFEPAVPSGQLWCSPQVPERLLDLRVERLNLAGAEVGVRVGRRGWSLAGLPAGVSLVRAPRPL